MIKLRQRTKRNGDKPRNRKGKQASRPERKELTRLGSALRALGGLGGGSLGSMIGMGSEGRTFGSGIGAALSKWLGSGDYVVSANTITQRASAGSIPAMHKEGQSIVVRHREFLTEVRGSTTFVVRNEFDINPGLSTTFPWLSGIAQQYSQYKIRGMVYHYVPTSGNAVSSTNAALGTVMLQTSYRATEPAPTSKIELLNEYWSSEAKPSEEFCHPIECDPRENPFNVQYVRSGNLPATENQLMYDLGRTTVAVSGQQANDVVLGDLWVTYEIELKKPVLTSLNNLDIQSFGSTGVSNLVASTPLGTDHVVRFDSMAAPVVVNTSGTSIDFSRGNVGSYQISIYWAGATSFLSPTAAVSGGLTAIPVVGTSGFQASSYSVGLGNAIYTAFVTMSNPDVAGSLIVGLGTLTGATRCRVLITEINPDVRVNT